MNGIQTRSLLLTLLLMIAPAMVSADCRSRDGAVFDATPDEGTIACQLQLIERNLPASAIAVEASRAEALLNNEGLEGVVADVSANRAKAILGI